jgi:hypothetical protein
VDYASSPACLSRTRFLPNELVGYRAFSGSQSRPQPLYGSHFNIAHHLP